ncbi:DUF3331 domain-containing protein [Burkholderia sp. 3C]
MSARDFFANRSVINQASETHFERALLRLLRTGGTSSSASSIATISKKSNRRKTLQADVTESIESQSQPSRIEIQEMLTPRSLSLIWSDAQSGNYMDQIWHLGVAGNDGFCSMSGQPIACGDPIFRPRRHPTNIPGNWNRMILASEVFEADVSTS